MCNVNKQQIMLLDEYKCHTTTTATQQQQQHATTTKDAAAGALQQQQQQNEKMETLTAVQAITNSDEGT